MSEHQTLRELVRERLTLAAEEIFALFERKIAVYEEELCRWREESQRKPHNLNPGLETTNPISPPHLCLDQGIPEFKEEQVEKCIIKEEECIKQEEEYSFVSLSSDICLKSEDPPLLLQTYTEQREEQREDTPDPPYPSQTKGHGDYEDDDWEHQAECSAAAHMETEADGDHHQALTPEIGPAGAHMETEADGDQHQTLTPEIKDTSKRKHQCYICQKRFMRNNELQRHIRVHTGEKPYSCSVCAKAFSQRINLDVHMRTHSSQKPYPCPACCKAFTQKVHLEVHLRAHTRERPYMCPYCDKTYTQKLYLRRHMETHGDALRREEVEEGDLRTVTD